MYEPTLVWDGDSLTWDGRTLQWDPFQPPPTTDGELVRVSSDRGRHLTAKTDRGRNLVVSPGGRRV